MIAAAGEEMDMRFDFSEPRARLLAAASSTVLAFALGGPAFAQAPAAQPAAEEADEGDVVIVTGFRASLQSSAETKRGSDAIVEAVTAEDVGKLPDSSITDALSRLPGLSTQRLFGRGQVLSVRGLAPDFTTALLNGREQVTAGDNRGVEFDQYPSELLQRVVVYKTPTASLIGQGLAGTADMETVRPLSVGERVLAASARYEWNGSGALVEGGDDSGYRLTGSYVDQTEDGTLGWALGITSMSSPTQAERFEAWGYPTTGTGAFILGGAKPYVQSSLLERDAVMGVIEFKPSNSLSGRIDAFYSEFNETQDLKGIEFPLWWSSASLQPGATVTNGLVTKGAFTGVDGVVRNDIRTRDTTLSALGANLKWDIDADWSTELDISTSSIDRNDLDLETYAGTGPGSAGANATLNFQTGNGSYIFGSNLNYADPALILLTDPQGWGQSGYIKEPQISDELTALRISATRQLSEGPVSSIEFGVNISHRQKDKASIESFIDLDCPGTTPNNQCAAPIPTGLRQSPTALAFLGIPGMVSYDPLAVLATPGLYVRRPNSNADVISKRWGVEEDINTFFLQFNVDSAIGEMPLTGNVGLQVVETDQSSTGGVRNSGGTATIVRQGDTYTEALPSANFALEFAPNNFLRLGLARTLARPRMDEMRASFEVGYNIPQFANANPTSPANSYWGGGGGNPKLRPWIANALDISYENYFGDAGGYFALAAFYKELESYVYPETIPYDFTGFPSHNGATPATFRGFASAPQNGEGGEIQGIELSANIPGETFAPSLEGFGLLFNASSTDSSIQPPNTPGNALPGLSENVINTTLYYERDGFEARISNRYRSDFLGEVTGFGAGRELRFVNGESLLDAQIGYRFGPGPLEGISVQLQAYNLTDEPFSGYANNDERLVRDYQTYGTTYLLGVSYRN
jgi:iron complex outermembrane receptor protein